MDAEHDRILTAYTKLEARVRTRDNFFGFENLAHVHRVHQRYRQTMCLLKSNGYYPLSNLKILDVGCADGSMLRQFMQWGAIPEHLAGIELRAEPVQIGSHFSPHIDIRCASAIQLPWADASFDLVCQHTVFTSILDTSTKHQVASEMVRVLRPGGAILWYDFIYNNPHNPDVKGIKASEVQTLFKGLEIHLHRITLAPFIARRLPKFTLDILYPILATVPILRTHYLGLLIKNF